MKKLLYLIFICANILFVSLGKIQAQDLVVKYPGKLQWTNQSIDFTADSTHVNGGGLSIKSYVWNFGDGTIISDVIAHKTHKYSTIGTFTVTLTRIYTDDSQDNVSETVKIVNDAPDFQIIYSKNQAGLDQKCAKYPIKFVADSLNTKNPAGGTIFSYYWDFDGPATANGTTRTNARITNIFTLVGTFQVQLIRYFIHPGTPGVIYSDTAMQTLVMYDRPVITMTRKNTSPDCIESFYDSLTISVVAPRTDVITGKLTFGDGNFVDYANIPDKDERRVTFSTSSCGKNARLNDETLCTDCFVPILIASNFCGTEIFTASPMAYRVFDKPKPSKISLVPIDPDQRLIPDSTNTAYTLCLSKDDSHTFNFRTKDSVSSITGNHEIGGDFCEGVENITIQVVQGSTVLYTTSPVSSNARTDDFTITGSGTFNIQALHTNACNLNDPVISERKLVVRDNPIVDVERGDDIKCYPSELTFLNKVPNDSVAKALTYTWYYLPEGSTPNDSIISDSTNIYSTNAIYASLGDYKVILHGDDGTCQSDDSLEFRLEEPCDLLMVPNAFIPTSNSEKFRTFRPVAKQLRKYRIEIYNLWGELLWESEEIDEGRPKTGWDGTYKDEPCSPGLYIWKISATLEDGSENGFEWQGQPESDPKRVGSFTLIR